MPAEDDLVNKISINSLSTGGLEKICKRVKEGAAEAKVRFSMGVFTLHMQWVRNLAFDVLSFLTGCLMKLWQQEICQVQIRHWWSQKEFEHLQLTPSFF